MTGRELIIYILANHLEDEPVITDNAVIGFYTPTEFAVLRKVGVATVDAWAKMGKIDTVKYGDSYLIPFTSLLKSEEERQ